MTGHCRFCSRDGVTVTNKGLFVAHVDAAGRHCIGSATPGGKPTRTPPRPPKGTTQRRRKGGGK